MKKYHFLLTFILLLMLGCERENFSDLEHQNSNTTIIPLEPIDVKNGMLVFMDEAHLTQVVSQCYKSIEMFSNIDPAVEGEIEENSNPMIQFENAYDYVSLRKAASFTTSNASADKYDDGSQAFFANHPVLGTLLNSQMEIQVGNSIFKAINDETIVEIKNADVATLNKIHSNPSSINSLNGVHVHSSNPSDECRMNRYTTSTMWYEGNNKRFFCELSINNFSGIHVAAATTRSEKKKGRSGRHYWVPYKTSISAQVYGSAVNNSCLQSATFSEYDSKNDGAYVRTAEYFNYTAKTKKDAIHSIHTCNGQTVPLTLSW